VELHGAARVTGSKIAPGGLQAMTGHDMNLSYAPDGDTLQHVLVVGEAALQLAGEPGKPGRRLAANAIDTFLAPDGSTPTALAGRDAVQLTFPAEPGVAARTIRSATVDAVGEPGKGLTKAKFGGNVEYRETGGTNGSGGDVGHARHGAQARDENPIDEAKFVGGVRFTEGKMAAAAAVARTRWTRARSGLGGSEPRPGASCRT
jgi:hypothetical protein